MLERLNVGILALTVILGFSALAKGDVSQSLKAPTYNLEFAHVPNQLIVKFVTDLKTSAKESLLLSVGAKTIRNFRASGASLIEYQDKAGVSELRKRARRLKAKSAVEYVEANTVISLGDEVPSQPQLSKARRANPLSEQNIPNDERFEELYGLHNTGQTGGTADADIDAPEAWAVVTGSRDVLVAVIDTGVDYTHPDIADNYWNNPGETGLDADGNDKTTNGIDDDGNGYIDDFRGWDFVNSDNDPIDDNDHGTHCAGTIGGHGNEGTGVAGVNWEVSIVGVKFLSAGGSGSLADAVSAIEYSTTLGVFLSSNSWGGGGFSETMNAAIEEAEAQGILFIAAAGNLTSDNDVSPHFPSSYEGSNVIAVAATDHDDGMASFSSYGLLSVDVGAPGVDILSSVPGNEYNKFSGTSMATPHVAGLAALIKSAYPDAESAMIKSRILNTVDPVTALDGKVATGGRINAFNSLEDDSIPPNAATNLVVEGATATSVTISFDAAGDDGDQGSARRYDLRYSEFPIVSDDQWNSAQRGSVTFIISPAGTVQATLGGLAFNTEGFVAVKAIDNVGNIGTLSTTIPFSVLSVHKILENLAESMDGVTEDAPWNLEEVDVGNQAFSDSPGENYQNDINIALTLDSISTFTDQLTLVFDSDIDLESGYDFAHVEISTDGQTWNPLATYTGRTAWARHIIELNGALGGATDFQLRFRLQTDYSIAKDGWKIDNIGIFAPEQ
jgi:subtilisin family serine protease